jgi:hypothetical protein
MDYGNMCIISAKDMYKLSSRLSNLGDIPERVFECAMAEIKPAAINSV